MINLDLLRTIILYFNIEYMDEYGGYLDIHTVLKKELTPRAEEFLKKEKVEIFNAGKEKQFILTIKIKSEVGNE